mmetsp:Transcript_13769/g.37279  ORF Transcript_13769/g.37279 Transcript_13769/m.37279 type:complete len:416 (+) Transcript_13769:70-1317(+)
MSPPGLSSRNARRRWRLLKHVVHAVSTLHLRGLCGVYSESYWALEAGEREKCQERSIAPDDSNINFSGVARKLLLPALLASIKAHDVLLKAFSQGQERGAERYSPSCVVLVTGLVSVFIGNVYAFCRPQGQSRLAAVGECWSPRRIMFMGVPASLFTLSIVLKFVGLGYTDAAIMMAVDQMGLLVTAVLGSRFARKAYSRQQWVALLCVTLGSFWFCQAQARSKTRIETAAAHSFDANVLGVLLCSVSMLASALGGIASELLLKTHSGTPFHVQKTHMEMAGVGAALFSCRVLEPAFYGSCTLRDRGLFAGWNRWTVAIFLLSLAKTWLAAMVVCVLDTIAYSLTGTAALLLVYAEELLLFSEDVSEAFEMESFLAMLWLAAAVAGVAFATHRKRQAPSAKTELEEPLLETRRPA